MDNGRFISMQHNRTRQRYAAVLSSTSSSEAKVGQLVVTPENWPRSRGVPVSVKPGDNMVYVLRSVLGLLNINEPPYNFALHRLASDGKPEGDALGDEQSVSDLRFQNNDKLLLRRVAVKQDDWLAVFESLKPTILESQKAVLGVPVSFSDARAVRDMFDPAPVAESRRQFIFVSRGEQSVSGLELLGRMDDARTTRGFEAAKRDVIIPTITGMPGIGKTRFASVFPVHTAYICCLENNIASPTPDDLLAVAPDLVQRVWPHLDDNTRARRRSLVCQLIAACFDGRNLRLDLSHLSLQLDSYGTPSEHSIAAALLAAWFAKQMLVSLTSPPPVVRSIHRQIMAAFDAKSIQLSVESVIMHILSAARPLGTAGSTRDDAPALIINLDEAQTLSERNDSLNFVLQRLLDPLWNLDARAFVIVSGALNSRIQNRVTASQLQFGPIVLPLLNTTAFGASAVGSVAPVISTHSPH